MEACISNRSAAPSCTLSPRHFAPCRSKHKLFQPKRPVPELTPDPKALHCKRANGMLLSTTLTVRDRDLCLSNTLGALTSPRNRLPFYGAFRRVRLSVRTRPSQG